MLLRYLAVVSVLELLGKPRRALVNNALPTDCSNLHGSTTLNDMTLNQHNMYDTQYERQIKGRSVALDFECTTALLSCVKMYDGKSVDNGIVLSQTGNITERLYAKFWLRNFTHPNVQIHCGKYLAHNERTELKM